MKTALMNWDWIVTHHDSVVGAIELAGLLVGVIAVMIAAKELRHVKKLLDSTANIAGSMSTRFVGQFPYNLNTLCEVLKQATSHVEIMVDIVAYGHYSSPKAFLEYSQQLQRIALDSQVKLRVIVYDEELTNRSRHDQFGGEQNFSTIREEPAFDVYFPESKGSIPPKQYSDFIDALAEREKLCHQTVRANGAEIRESSEQFRFFLWLVDEVEAVFSFQMYGEHFHEICFRTRDGNLIRTFSRMFEQSWSKARVAKLKALPAVQQTARTAAADLYIQPGNRDI